MKPINDEELLNIYFKQATPKEVDDCLKNPETCQQLDQLEADMRVIEQALDKHPLPDDYGQQLWHKIADQLEPQATTTETKPSNWMQQIQNMLLMPQFSLASLVLVAGLVMLTFYAGQKQNGEAMSIEFQQQLLAQNIQLHLTQSEIFLTQVNHGGGHNNQATAQRLLTSNRIFKQALAKHEGQFTNQLLQDLEPVLLEFANQIPDNSNQQIHGQQPQANWVNNTKSNDLPNNLMFQIKAMKHKLAANGDII